MIDKAEEFLNWIRDHKTKNTFHVYEFGLKKFLGFVGKSGTEIIQDAKKRFMSDDQQERNYWKTQILDFKNSLSKQGLTQNTARTQSTGAVSFFKFFGIVITLEKDFWEVQITLNDFVPSIEQYRQMFQVGDIRAKLLISMGLDLAWRIGDITNIKKKDLPDLTQEPPLPFEKVTEKEKVVGKSFLSSETVELLKAYISTLKPENNFLFQNGNGSSIQDQTVNDILQNLAKKSGLKIPENKTLRFHCFRKRFLSTCADCGIDQNLARILVGKAVEISMLTYLGEANLKNAWSKVKEKLTLSNGTIKATMDTKDARIEQLEKELAQTRAMFKLLAEAQSETVTKALLKKLKENGYHEAIVFGGPPDTTVLIEGEKVKIEPIHGHYTAQNIIDKLLEIEQLKQERAYKKLLENGNGNNHNGTTS